MTEQNEESESGLLSELAEHKEYIGGRIVEAETLLKSIRDGIGRTQAALALEEQSKSTKSDSLKRIEASNQGHRTEAQQKDKEAQSHKESIETHQTIGLSIISGNAAWTVGTLGTSAGITVPWAMFAKWRMDVRTQEYTQKISVAEASAQGARAKIRDTGDLQKEIGALDEIIAEIRENLELEEATHEFLDARKLYQLALAEKIVDQGMERATELHAYAQRNGTSIDDIIEEISVGHSVLGLPNLDAFFRGDFGLNELQQLVDWSARWAGQTDKVAPDIKTLVQYVNHVVIPNQDQFEIWASKIDDARAAKLNPTGLIYDLDWELKRNDAHVLARPSLEILGQKAISLSGRRDITKLPDPSNLDPAVQTARDAALLDLPYYYDPSRGGVLPFVRQSNAIILENVARVDALIAESADKIQKLIDELASQQQAKLDAKSEYKRRIDHNADIEARISQGEAELQSRIKRDQDSSNLRIAATVGISTILRLATVIASGGVDPGPLMDGLVASAIFPISSRIGQEREHRRLIESNRSQSAELRKGLLDDEEQNEIVNKIFQEIKNLTSNKEFQSLFKDEVSRIRLQRSLLMQSVVGTAMTYAPVIDRIAAQNGMGSIDEFFHAYAQDPREGRVYEGLVNFAFGVFNSNDLEVLIDTGNRIGLVAIPRQVETSMFDDFFGRTNQSYVIPDEAGIMPRERTMLAVAEELIKPNIGKFRLRSHMNDALQQANMVGSALVRVQDREMVRDMTDKTLHAIFSEEYGLSILGQNEIRRMFDYWMHRHGDRDVSDALVRDDLVSVAHDAPKSLESWNDKEIERFLERVCTRQAYARKDMKIPASVLLRICGSAYFEPQAALKSSVPDIFEGNEEGYASHAMAALIIREFTRRLGVGLQQDYRTHVQDKLDALITQSFIDFFGELGQLHSQDPEIMGIRMNAHNARNHEAFDFSLKDYVLAIAKDAAGRFDLFLDIYKCNLEEQLNVATLADRKDLERQISEVVELSHQQLSPELIRPGSHASRLRAFDENHTLRATSWKARAEHGMAL